MNSKITQLSKICKKYSKDKNILDIILYGSYIRGKDNPKDIDIIIIFKDIVNKDREYQIRKELSKKIDNIQIISKTEEQYKEPSFDAREGILFEGYSLISNLLLAENYGFRSLGMFIYQTNKLSNVNKTRFYYALNGRKEQEGIIKTIKAIKLSNNVILVNLDKIETAKDFFEFWKIEYKYVPTLLPIRMGKASIINKVR
jgi:predicted nucleotidyltransferase